ncbi:MAG TPA: hypothetical protein VMY06_14725 [Sedimentisphaerales bacterium]|nr:hypothetical protein [Sedimentisphaerales bacterium]HUU15604.1 hypothetical protein [Sedimentisphaerales bacterium]
MGITEDTIEQTKFFIGEDGKFYLVKDVRTVKLVTLICTRDGSESDLLLGDDICSRFEPAEASFEPFTQKQKVTKKALAKPVRKPRKLGKRKKSKYIGVFPYKPTKSGKIRYRATYWDGKKKKTIHLGTYDSDIEAAAVYQDHIGNKAKAAEYRSLDAVRTTGSNIRQSAQDRCADSNEHNEDALDIGPKHFSPTDYRRAERE